MAKNLTPELVPLPDYIEPELRKNGRWSYGFGDLEVGDQMRCPRSEGESYTKSRARVGSAAVAWKTKHFLKERAHIRFRTMGRTQYILLERVS